MKRIYLSLLGAMMALTASAQFNWLCDSIYMVNASDGQRVWFIEYSYDNGVLMEEYNYVKGGYRIDDSGALTPDPNGDLMWKCTKIVYGYDDAGRNNKLYEYEKVGDNWKLITVRDYVSFNEGGGNIEIIDYDVDDDDKDQLLPTWRYVFTYEGNYAVQRDKYASNFGSWELYNTTKFEYNAYGWVIKETTTREAFGQTYISTTYNEYDDHGCKTKEVFTSDEGSYILTFEPSYDANGLHTSSKQYTNGQEDNTSYYFYSLGGHTAIKGVKASAGTANGWFDLNGRRINGQPTKKGLYIHDGRKVLIK